MTRKIRVTVVALALVTVTVAAYYRATQKPQEPQVVTATVTRGDVIARLDPSLFEAQVAQARANLVKLQADESRAPIDGIVIQRSVDLGQTVAASMQAPTLFVLAQDLTRMQVKANIDGSDIGQIRPGQRVRFRGDAYQGEEFTGTVAQIRLQPVVQQNVVSYQTIVSVPNLQLKLKPGMTATVTVEIARQNDVLRVPAAALRFRPTAQMFAALGYTPPERPRASTPSTRCATSSARLRSPPILDARKGCWYHSQPRRVDPVRDVRSLDG